MNACGRVWMPVFLYAIFVLRESGAVSADSAYDTSKGVFSPRGRLVQLDYLEGIVQRGNLCMGAECKDGVVLATTKLVSDDTTKLVDRHSTRRIYRVDSHIGILPAGLPADGRALAQKAMELCRSHRREYGEPIPGRVLADHMGEFIHQASLLWGVRAYPNVLLIACHEGGGADAREEARGAGPTPSDNGGGADGEDGEGGGAGRKAGEGTTSPRGREADGMGSSGGAERLSRSAGPEGNSDRDGTRARAVEEPKGRNHHDDGPTSEGCWGGGGKGGGGKGGGGERDSAPQLFVVEPNGASCRHSAACVGQGSHEVRQWMRQHHEGHGEGKGQQGPGFGAPGSHRAGPFTLFTCEEAAAAMLEAAKKGRGKEGTSVECLEEVGWVHRASRGKDIGGRWGQGAGAEMEVDFVHHRTFKFSERPRPGDDKDLVYKDSGDQ